MAEYDLGTARGKIEIDAKGAKAGVDQAIGHVDDLGKRSGASSAAIASVGLSLVGVGVAAVGAFGYAIKVTADFEKQLSGFKAVTGSTGAEMDAVREKALQLGADTSFSAAEAATAMVELGKQGLSVTDILNGAADATVALAAAGEIDLPEAAKISAAALNQFKLQAKDLPEVADLLAGAANASATGVSEVGLALSYVGPVANAVGLTIQDTAGAIALLANNGIDGQKAGTALRAILSRLSPTSKEAANEMKALGLITKDGKNIFYDATGKLKPMNEIIGILGESTAGLTAEQKQNALQTIFGTEALAAASVMAGTTEDAYVDLSKKIGDVKAQDVAAEKLNNLSGSMEQLKGSIETMLIKAGTPFQAGLKGIVDQLTKVVNWLGQLNPEVQKWIGYVVAGTGALALLVGGLLLAHGALGQVKTAMSVLNAVLIANPIGLVVTAIGALVAGLWWLYNNNETFRKGVDKLWESFGPVWDQILAKLMEVKDWVAEHWPPVWEAISGAARTAWEYIQNEVVPKAVAVAFWIYATYEKLRKWWVEEFWPDVKEVWDNLVGAFTTAYNYANDTLIPKLSEIWDKVSPGWNSLVNYANTAIVGALKTVSGQADETKKHVDAAASGPSPQAQTQNQSMWTSIGNWTLQYMIPLMGQITDLWNNLAPHIGRAWNRLMLISETSGKILLGIIAGIGMSIAFVWRFAWQNVQNIAMIIWNTIKTIFGLFLNQLTGLLTIANGILERDWGKVWNGMLMVFSSVWGIITNFLGMGLKIFASIMGAGTTMVKTIWDNAWNGIEGTFNKVRNGIVIGVGAFLSTIYNLLGVNNLFDAGRRLFQSLWDGMKSIWEEIKPWLMKLNPAEYKGPPERDAKMLVRNGELIMGGLQVGLENGWQEVKGFLGNVTKEIKGVWGGGKKVYEDNSFEGMNDIPWAKKAHDFVEMVQRQEALKKNPELQGKPGWGYIDKNPFEGWDPKADFSKWGQTAIEGLQTALAPVVSQLGDASMMASPGMGPASMPSNSSTVTLNFDFRGVGASEVDQIKGAMNDTGFLKEVTRAARAGVGA